MRCNTSLALRVAVVPRWRFGLVFDPRPFSGDNLSEPTPTSRRSTPMPRPSFRLRLALLASMLIPVAVAFGLDAPPADPDPAPAFLVLPYLQLPAPTGVTILWEA